MLKDPFMISSIILAITFLILLIINQKIKSKVIKYVGELLYNVNVEETF